MKIAAIVLAAGASRRLGRPKQLLTYEGETLIARVARIASEAGLSPVLIVVRADATFQEPMSALGYECVINEEAAEGMAASIRCGIAAAQGYDLDGVVLLACDQPAVDTEHLKKLMEEPVAVTASAYKGTRGVPAYFPATQFEELLLLRGDKGARELLRSARVVLNEKLAFDVDTLEDARELDS